MSVALHVSRQLVAERPSPTLPSAAFYQASEPCRLLLLAVLEAHGTDEPVGTVHQIDIGRVHDGVATIVLGNLVMKDFPMLRRGGDLRLAASEPDDARVEGNKILALLLGSVVVRW